MYTITLLIPDTTVSIRRWKLLTQPICPIGLQTHWNCPAPFRVNAVKWRDLGCSTICQNPAVRSMVVKMTLPERPISLMHSLTSFMEYLLMCDAAFKALKSCTMRTPPFFFITTNNGLLYFERVGSTTPNRSHSATCRSTSCWCASAMGNCFTYTGSFVLSVISCIKVSDLPR